MCCEDFAMCWVISPTGEKGRVTTRCSTGVQGPVGMMFEAMVGFEGGLKRVSWRVNAATEWGGWDAMDMGG